MQGALVFYYFPSGLNGYWTNISDKIQKKLRLQCEKKLSGVNILARHCIKLFPLIWVNLSGAWNSRTHETRLEFEQNSGDKQLQESLLCSYVCSCPQSAYHSLIRKRCSMSLRRRGQCNKSEPVRVCGENSKEKEKERTVREAHTRQTSHHASHISGNKYLAPFLYTAPRHPFPLSGGRYLSP